MSKSSGGGGNGGRGGGGGSGNPAKDAEDAFNAARTAHGELITRRDRGEKGLDAQIKDALQKKKETRQKYWDLNPGARG